MRADRGDAAVDSDHGGWCGPRSRARDDVIEIALAEPLGRELQRAACRELGAEAESHPVGQIVLVRVAAFHVAHGAGDFDHAGDLLAANEVEGRVHLPGARSLAGRSRRRFHHAADSERHRVLTRLGQQVDFRADERVAEIVPDPAFTDERVVVVDAAEAVAPETEDRDVYRGRFW